MPDELSPCIQLRALVAKRLPEYNRALSAVRRELDAYAWQVHSAVAPRGIGLLLAQTANDFIDVLDDISMVRGRPAMRGLRSIFESLITMLEIASDGSEVLDRYTDQYAIDCYQAATMNAGLTGLNGDDLRSERHRRRKQQCIHKQARDKALAKTEWQSRKAWPESSLKDRAARHGYNADYDLYRVLSSLVHVTAGGARGIERQYNDQLAYRLGPDLQNCPMVFNESLRFFRLFAEALSTYMDISAERLIRALSALEALRSDYRKLISVLMLDCGLMNFPQ